MVFAGDLLQLTAYIAPFRVIVNSVEKEFENPIVTINDRTYVPLREVGEVLGMNVEWDGENQKIIIGNSQNTPQEWVALYPFEQDGLWGYENGLGDIVIEARFIWVREFSEGLALVSKGNGQIGYIDLTGTLVIPLPNIVTSSAPWGVAYNAWDFSEGFARIIIRRWDWNNETVPNSLAGPTIFIDRTGRNIFNQEFATARDFQNGYAEVTLLNGTRTHIDRQGNIVDR